MTKLSDQGPMITGRRNGGPLENEADYFYLSPICGQPVDMQDLSQVMWHDRPVHYRLEIDGRHH
ncbi:MAG: hypothetical protein E5W38_01695 [Mesorhizobium sp.]|nr:hypothetical protein EJ070_03840 [Mesorhizobium sp. M1E.F.Ca.ET.045.02.1.1]RUW38467.1 hypothetical protein EOA38_00620 [Mesorhizobium sp. M1E.F.Ca.ET.041.01.1.1]RUW83731.1 hypothetical protein EOA29_12200 [Mesorhizobium sp. M1E.F.Ca.ET.063.01.1.1]RWD90528.1 MAG: hypothetical protein EOS39_19310 [Mesorhizobium sp.]RWD91781.1 MAG: hypothetical protein EOS38_03885 [Mesorhizobium sp.]